MSWSYTFLLVQLLLLCWYIKHLRGSWKSDVRAVLWEGTAERWSLRSWYWLWVGIALSVRCTEVQKLQGYRDLQLNNAENIHWGAISVCPYNDQCYRHMSGHIYPVPSNACGPTQCTRDPHSSGVPRLLCLKHFLPVISLVLPKGVICSMVLLSSLCVKSITEIVSFIKRKH